MQKANITLILVIAPQSSGLKASLNALDNAIAQLKKKQKVGFDCLVLKADDDKLSSVILASWKQFFKVIEYSKNQWPNCKVECLNQAFQSSKSEFLAYMSAGDLISENWLTQSIEQLLRSPASKLILHPEINFAKNHQSYLVADLKRDPAKVNPWRMLWGNPWPSLFVIQRKLALQVPFSNLPKAFSQSLWHWYCEGLVVGLRHSYARGTAAIVANGSEFAEEFNSKYWCPPVLSSKLFQNLPNEKTKGARVQEKPRSFQFVGLSKIFHEMGSSQFGLRDMGEKKITPSFYAELPPSSDDPRNPVLMKLYQLLIEPVDHFFIVHQLRRGGAELEAILHIEFILKSQPKAKILICVTESCELDWADRLPKGVQVFDLGRSAANKLDWHKMTDVLLAACIQFKPKKIHLKHSSQGWELYRSQGEALSQSSALYASMYCVDYDHENNPTSFAFTHLPKAMPWIKTIFCDNYYFAKFLVEHCGYSTPTVLKFPVRTDFQSPKKVFKLKNRKVRILWASRIARQKNLELFFEIVSSFPNYQFEMYGEFSHLVYNFELELRKRKNIFYHGSFNGIDSIDISDIDIFLYTSSWDGLPNILLEVGAKGLPIVASDVGGVGELISTDRGYLARSLADFKRAIKAIEKNPKEALAKAQRLQKYILSDHNEEQFNHSLTNAFDYLQKDFRKPGSDATHQ